MAKDRPKTTTKVRGKPTTQPAPKAAKAPRGAKAPAKATKATKAPAKTTKAAKAPAKTTKAAKAPAKTAKGAKAPAKTAKAAKGTKATKAAKAAPVASLEPMDPGVKVKRPLNSFMIFAKDQRAVLRQTHPNLHHSELSKLIGTSWNELSSEDRAIYQQRADQLKQEHQALYPNYRFQPKRRNKAASNDVDEAPPRKKRAYVKKAQPDIVPSHDINIPTLHRALPQVPLSIMASAGMTGPPAYDQSLLFQSLSDEEA